MATRASGASPPAALPPTTGTTATQRVSAAFVSTYPPRRCGIATFTAHLSQAVGSDCIVALRGPADPARWDDRVCHEIRTDVPADFGRVARSLHLRDLQIVSVQHEYGIWGTDDGVGVLDFLAALSLPAVVTLHTVLRWPSEGQRRIMQGILDAVPVVVMSRSAAHILADRYRIDTDRMQVIPHGVPDLPFLDPDRVKPSEGLEGRRVVLSFGLLSPGKGYESVIAAMPEVVRVAPDACYVIVGSTHPSVLRARGEDYRARLAALVQELGLNDHVLFVDRFIPEHELHRWLALADVFVTPYPNHEQVVSGTLSYALAAGKAIVSTPYPYAAEMLADGCGILLPANSSATIADALATVLCDHGLRTTMAEQAYARGRALTWPLVAASYRRLFARSASRKERRAPLRTQSFASGP